MTLSGAARASVIALVVLHATAQPIQLHPANPHYFLFRGKAIALVGSGEHYGAVMNLDFDYQRYLATLESAGLNYTRLFGGSYREMPGKSFGIARNDLAPAPGRYLAPWARSETPGYAGGGNKFDLDRWSPEYFARFHDFLGEASRRGVIVELSFFSSTYQPMMWDLSPLNTANNVNRTDPIDWKKLHTLENGNILARQEQYVRKLVREANAFDNVIFEIQNEPWSDRTVLTDFINRYLPAPARNAYPNSVDLADALSIAWQAAVAGWIADEESKLPAKHLIAQNYCNFRYPVRDLVPGVSVVNFHYAYPEAVALNYGLAKAISYDETGFLGRDDATYRREAWNFMLSGGSTFDMLDYSFSPGHEDGSDRAPNGPGGGSPALRSQLRVLADFLRKLPLENMRPDAGVVKHVTGAYAHALADGQRLYAMYFDGSGPISVTLALGFGGVNGQWINTKTGAVVSEFHFRKQEGDSVLQSPEFREGIALVITRPMK